MCYPYNYEQLLKALADARNPATSLPRLRELAETYNETDTRYDYYGACYAFDCSFGKEVEDWDIREAVAAHPNANLALLTRLSKDKNSSVVTKVSQNKNTPKALFLEMVRHRAGVEYATMDDRLTGDDFVELVLSHKRLASDRYLIVRAVKASLTSQKYQLSDLVASGSEAVRRHIAEQYLTDGFATVLAAAPEVSVRVAVASNPVTPTAIVQRLTEDKSLTVRRAAVANSSLPLTDLLIETVARSADKKPLNAAAKAREADIRTWATSAYPELAPFAEKVSLSALVEFVTADPRF